MSKKRNRRYRIIAIVIAVALAAAMGASPGTSAHIYFGGETTNCNRSVEHCPRDWFFYGAIYHGNTRTDPVNVVFKGGKNINGNFPGCDGDGQANEGLTPTCAKQLMEADWPDMHKAPAICDTDASLIFRRPVARSQHNGALNSGGTFCSTEFHIRNWDDSPHASLSSGHGKYNQWVVGGLHHERRGSDLDHHIDKDWTSVRAFMRTQMAEQCSRRRWAYHPGADQNYQRHENDGIVLRISRSRVAWGLGGAKPHRCDGQ
jgi:hypothetical protein